MASLYNTFSIEDKKSVFTKASDAMTTHNTETFTEESRSGASTGESVFSPLAPSFHSRNGGNLINSLLHQSEPRAADTAPANIDIDQMLMNLRMGGSEIQYDDVDHNSHKYYMEENVQSMGGGRSESMSSNIWGDGSSSTSTAARTGEMMDTFDFFIKSLSSANNYVSMLTREQLSVLRSIRPSLLYEFLQEVVKVRSDKRMRRALPNECAFCKNNGENEECYGSHSLKDWRGRVLCPVLRAFRCPRCGATGDRAHTIKYCPENDQGGLERSGSFASRRRVGSSSLLLGQQPAVPAPSPSPTASMSHTSLWNNFNMN